MITFERTFDADLISRILTDPRIYGRMSDDFSPARENYVPPRSDEAVFVAVNVDSVVQGLWVFVPQNAVCWEVHTALLPEIWGPVSHAAAPLCIDWIWKNTGCRRIITNCPVYHRAAISYAKASGMKEFGINEDSIMRHGKLHAQVMLGISKPEVAQCPLSQQ